MIGNRDPNTRVEPPEQQAPLNDRVLACLATWTTPDGRVIEPTTPDIAARLGITAETYLRDELNHVLTELKKRRLVAYEHDGPRTLLRWRLTGPGWAIARAMRTGTTGFSRSGDPKDRGQDRYAKTMGQVGTEGRTSPN